MNDTTITDVPRTAVTGGVDLYRDIHKGLRHALFDVTFRAGRLDVGDDECMVGLLVESRQMIDLLRGHHQHEEQLLLEGLIEAHAPAAVGPIHDEHHKLAVRLDRLAARADELAATATDVRSAIAHEYYLELAAFTAAYLAHLDVEERVVMPALAAACDDAELGRVQGAVLASIRPEQQAVGLSVMLPALNPVERAEMVGRIRMTAPPEAFAGVRKTAARVLTTVEYARLGITDV